MSRFLAILFRLPISQVKKFTCVALSVPHLELGFDWAICAMLISKGRQFWMVPRERLFNFDIFP